MKRSSLMWLVAAAGLTAASCGAPSQQFAITHVENRAVLANGLRLIVMPDETTNLVQVDVHYEVGQKEDPVGKAGLAHLVEHMLFQHRFGAETTPIEQRLPTFQVMPQIASFFNAFTSWDVTHYYEQAPAEGLETLLRLEAARMVTGCKTILETEFEREREVVRNEIRQRGGTPEGQIYQEILNRVYPEGHAYREMMGGNDQQLTNIVFDDVCKFMADYYVPRNATVIVSGNVNPDKVGVMVQKYFGGIPDKAPAPKKDVAPITPDYQKDTVELAIERDVVSLAFALPPQTSDEFTAAQFMVYNAGMIISKMADEWDVGELVDFTILGGALAPIALMKFEVKKGESPNDVLEYIWKGLAVARRGADIMLDGGGYNAEKVAKTLYKQQLIEQFEPLSARGPMIGSLVQFDDSVDFESDDVYFYNELDKIDSLETSKYESVVRRILDKDHTVVVIAKASEDGSKGDKRVDLDYKPIAHTEREAPVVDLSEANRPLKAPETNSILPKAERYTLGNGMKVVLLAYKGLPIVNANLVFHVGSSHESVSKAGVAVLAARYLHQPIGATVYSRSGVSFRGNATMDQTTIEGRGMNVYLDVIIKGLERLVKAGEIEQKQIEQYVSATKADFKRESYLREHAFGMELATALYGAEHPYTTKGSPTPKSLSNLGRDAAMDFVRDNYTASNATLIVVGNFDVKAAKEHIEDNFGGWDSGSKDEPVTTAAAPRTGPEFIGILGRDQQPQMRIAIAYPAPAGVDDQYAARQVLTEMLNQRMGTVRSELGSTYGAYAFKGTSAGPTAYQMGGNVDAPRGGESLAYMRKKIDELRAGDGFERDFVVARRIVLKKLISESTESRALASRLRTIEAFGLPPDHYDNLVRFVAKVTPAQVKALMAKELDPKNEIVVLMADRPTLEASFAEAGLDQVRYVEPKAD